MRVCGTEENERKDDTNAWIKIEWKGSIKNKISPPVLTTTNNAFALLSVSKAPITTHSPPVTAPSPISHKTDDNTTMLDSKIAC
jgi:hypothetical protein